MVVDMRSDTLTHPTDEMRRAMAAADVGDDVYGEDPTINRLEAMAAARVGKEAGLYVPTGSMGNLVAMMSHTQRGDQVILEYEAHIYHHEVGALSSVAGLLPRLIPSDYGAIAPAALRAAVSQAYPRTSLVCLENTHNRHGGTVLTAAEMAAVSEVAAGAGMKVHLDGARLFNAAVALGVEPTVLTRHVDSVMFCVSKGLSAPVGSVVCGTKDFIGRARSFRKALGGGMRQAGVLAACGIVALEKMVDRLAEDNMRARRLAETIADLGGLGVDLSRVQSNMVVVNGAPLGLDAAALARELAARGVKGGGRPPSSVRLVVNRHHGDAEIGQVVEAVKDLNRAFRS
ncbi:MAG: GntG family PLP-dependent aldolase [Bacillota bacterium]|nr:GntG family PLP-dependent aldolase [Bacillota bacterium]